MLELFRRPPVRDYPVQVMTIPRSGHNLLMRMLARVNPEMRYCEFHSFPVEGCCKSNPCRRDMHLVKSHDFLLDVPVKRHVRYIVQVRPVVPTLVSHFDLLVDGNHIDDTREAFEAFALKTIVDHRIPFVRKWLGGHVRNRLVVHYADLTHSPKETVARVSQWLWGEMDIPELEVIRPPRDVEAFRFHDAAFFRRLHRLSRKADAEITGFKPGPCQ